jgi:hypothetical protein
VYDAIRKLIHQEWHTSADGQTDANGRFPFRGFRGSYDLTVTANGKTAKARAELQASRDNVASVLTVTLP